MLSPPDIETPFRARARHLQSPLARNFDPQLWQSAYEGEASTTDQDRRLLEAILWIGRETRALYERNADLLNNLSPADAVMLALAALNFEFQILEENLKSERESLPADAPVGADYLSNLRVGNAHGQRFTSGDLMETAIDATESWLFDANRLAGAERPFEGDAVATAGTAITFYSMRNVLKGLYHKALHEGRHLDETDGDLWIPLSERLVALQLAWQGRAEASLMTDAHDLMFEWQRMSQKDRRGRGLARSATGAKLIAADKVALQIGRVSYLSKRPSARALERAGFPDSEVGYFMDSPLPKASGLTPHLLADAWWVLADVARRVSALGRSPQGGHRARLLAATVEIGELEECLVKALRIEPSTAQAILQFLTFKENSVPTKRKRDGGAPVGYRGLWSAPLVPVPGESAVAMPRAVFLLGNAVWRVEAWLEKGGIDDSAVEHRGDHFEKAYRQELCHTLSCNRVLPQARIAPEGVRKTADFSEQVDLVLRLGDRLIVGEVKYFLTPADPSSLRLHFIKLAGAATQATRKAAALASRPDVVARALGISETEAARLSVQPIVVLNQGFGFSMKVGGCRVVDAKFLRSFLATGYLRTGGISDRFRARADKVTTLYETEAEAAAQFDTIMAEPPLLTRFLNRITWDEIPYPRPTGGYFRIKSPFRGDITEAERAEAEPIIAAMRTAAHPRRSTPPR